MKPSVYVVFCEDVRHEVGGTTSFIGMMNGNRVIFEEPEPLTLPRLTLVAFIKWRASKPPVDCSLEISSGNDKEAMDFPIPPIDDDAPTPDLELDEVNVTYSYEMSPLIAKSGFKIEARLRSGKKREYLASLRFKALPEDEYNRAPTPGVKTFDRSKNTTP